MVSDKSLMESVCKGDHQAFTALVQRHTQRFYMLALRTLNNQSDAEDITQAAFIKLWQAPQRWNPNKSEFTTWFYRVVLNACSDLQRKNGGSIGVDSSILESLSPAVASEQDRLLDNQLAAAKLKCLHKAITKLPNSQRDALNLVVYSALPQRQAAEVMGINTKALESLLSRAKAKLRQDLASPNKHFDKLSA